MKKKKKRGRKAAGTKKTPRARKPQRVVRKKRAVKKAAAVPLPAPPVETPPYVAPRRVHIKDAVCALLPHVDPRLIKKLDYWALYTIHQDVVKSGADPETLARKLIKGYDPAKALPVKPVVPESPPLSPKAAAKEQERMMRAQEIENRKMDAKNRGSPRGSAAMRRRS